MKGFSHQMSCALTAVELNSGKLWRYLILLLFVNVDKHNYQRQKLCDFGLEIKS